MGPRHQWARTCFQVDDGLGTYRFSQFNEECHRHLRHVAAGVAEKLESQTKTKAVYSHHGGQDDQRTESRPDDGIGQPQLADVVIP